VSDLGFDISQLDIERQYKELERFECEQSLYEFLKTAWPHMDPAQFSGNWHIQAVAEHLQAVVDGDIKRLIINVPPRSTKTALCSKALPAWTWCQPEDTPTSGPGVKFMYSSYGEDLSLEHSVECRRLIKSEWYQDHWGDRFTLLGDQDTKHKFVNSKGGERQITSIGARVTGRGGQIFVIDDPNATSDANSEAKLKEVIDWWDGTARSRLNDKKTGAFIVIQQRVAETDLSGHLLEHNDGEWDHLMIPLEYEPQRTFKTSIGWEDPRTRLGQLLWPERFDEKFVATEKKSQWVYAGQYQQRPEPAGGGIIKRSWWCGWDEPHFPPFDYILASLDTAYTSRTENDPSAMTVWGVFTTDGVAKTGRIINADGRPEYWDRPYNETAPKLMLMFAWSEHLEFFELIKKVEKTCKDLKVDKLLIENKAAGISLAQELKRLYGHAEFGVQLSDPKSLDKLARLFSVQHVFEEEIVYAPDRPWAEQVITEVAQFPKGRRDDLCDTVSQAIRHLRDIGLLTRSRERMEQIESAVTYPGGQTAPLYPV
jgi:predicted phage terminase large subunit-like protein